MYPQLPWHSEINIDIHEFNKYSLSSYSVSSAMLNARDLAINITQSFFHVCVIYFLLKEVCRPGKESSARGTKLRWWMSFQVGGPGKVVLETVRKPKIV